MLGGPSPVSDDQGNAVTVAPGGVAYVVGWAAPGGFPPRAPR